MNVYSIDIKICATAYIKAESEEEAERIFNVTYVEHMGGELPVDDDADISVSERDYRDPQLPATSLSPAISFYGSWTDSFDLDLVEEGVPETDGEDA
jgi:hypothetical protein